MRARWNRRCGDLHLARPAIDREAGSELVTTAEEVPVREIIGTVARCCDFDRCFRPLRADLREHLNVLRGALRNRHLPTIRLARVGDDYFVVDGHHRVALALERGMVAIDALVTCYCRPRRS